MSSLKERISWQYRKLTARQRALPDFIVIGAQKAGTTSLYYHLKKHPNLIESCFKEVHYFDGGLDPRVDTFAKGPLWYRRHFATTSELGQGRKCFEACPLYLFNPLAAQRMRELVPQVKLIALLRNPTQRAVSQYFHERRQGHESEPILQALRAEEARLEPLLRTHQYKHHDFISKSYKSRGLYREQLDRYLRVFPREQLLILDSEEFMRAPEKGLQRVLAFVGVDPAHRFTDLKPWNVGTNKTQVDNEVIAYLDDFFRPHNTALREMLNEDLGW